MANEAELELLAAMQGLPAQQAALAARQRRAQAMFDTPFPQGQQVGRVYRAPSAIEALAAALTRGIGGRQLRNVEGEYGRLAETAQRGAAAQARAAQAEKTELAPPEWGLPPGVRRSEAISGRLLAAPKPPSPTELGRLIAERDALPPDDPRRADYDRAIQRETTHSPAQAAPYYTFLQSGEGYLRGNARSGEVTPVIVGGKSPLPVTADPDLQRRLAQEKASGKATGEDITKAQVSLPKAEAQADELLRLTDELLTHPGFSQAVGKSSIVGIQKIPGTDARDFAIRLDQIKGKQFLEAFNSLKGGGQITEAEGKKATEAIARMNLSQSEPEFRQAVKDFQDVVRAGLARTGARAAQGSGRVLRYNPQTGRVE